jgi:ABC-2 type transport system ATP-binding protein/ribosome-dependent ATPase
MLLGLLEPSEGTAHLLGGLPERSSRSRLGYVPQSLGLYGELTVAENVQFTAEAYGATARPLAGVLAAQADHLVADIGLGLQRQLAFHVALQHDPEVLVLDEPTSGVEPLARARLWDIIRAQADRGVGVLVTTHYMQEAQQCDRLLLMSRGRLVARGSESDIVAGTSVVEVSADSWAQAFAALGAAELPVSLAGRTVRVVDVDPSRVREVLATAGVPAALRPVPPTIEERMTSLARGGGDPT